MTVPSIALVLCLAIATASPRESVTPNSQLPTSKALSSKRSLWELEVGNWELRRMAQASTPAAKPQTKRPAPAEFDRLVKAATEARLAERWEEAIALYAKAVKLKPDYVEGHWYQGTAYYS